MTLNSYPKRFLNAVDKLITAYVKDELKADVCTRCAVGNICNQSQDWYPFIRMWDRGSCSIIDRTGYSTLELRIVEDIFMKYAPCADNNHTGSNFDGLVKVIDYLAELDNIDLDQTIIFKEALKNKEELCLMN